VTEHEQLEQLHASDFKAWCTSLDSRFRSEGFSTMSESENAMQAFMKAFTSDFDKAAAETQKTRDR
jgi:hypothetical protein